MTAASSSSEPLVPHVPLPGSNPASALQSAGTVYVTLQMPPSTPKWTEEFQAIATPVVAVIAAMVAGTIALRQWKTADAARETARNKLKLDLFEKRWQIYEAALSLINDSFLTDESHEYEPQDWLNLKDQQKKLNGAKWLLDDKVDEYLKGISREAADRHVSIIKRKNKLATDVVPMNWQTQAERVRERTKQLNELFAPFMTIQH